MNIPTASVPMQSEAEQPGRRDLRSVSECVADLIRTGKDAQLMLEPLRSFCQICGYEEEAVSRGDCEEAETAQFLLRQVDELDHLLDQWDSPGFSTLVPKAQNILEQIFEAIDDLVDREEVGEWNATWYGLFNGISKRHPMPAANGENAISRG